MFSVLNGLRSADKVNYCLKGCCVRVLPLFLVNIVDPKTEAFEFTLAHRMKPSASEDVLRSCFVCIVPTVV